MLQLAATAATAAAAAACRARSSDDPRVAEVSVQLGRRRSYIADLLSLPRERRRQRQTQKETPADFFVVQLPPKASMPAFELHSPPAAAATPKAIVAAAARVGSTTTSAS